MIETSPEQVARTRAGRSPVISASFMWLCGVVLPILAIIMETTTGVCTWMLDPLPNVGYTILVAAVPLCNALAWLGLRRDAFHHRRRFAAISGFSGAIALYYAILFIPMMPMAFIGLIVLLPILAFAPLLSLLTSAKLMRAWAGFAGRRAVFGGAALGLLALIALASPAIGVRAGAVMANSDRPSIRDTGFRILQLETVRRELREACDPVPWAGARQFTAWISGRGAVTEEEAGGLFWRVTGRAFEDETPARSRLTPVGFFDVHRGGDRVGAKLPDVRLSASRLDGTVDAASAAAYLEWTLEFHNSGVLQQEARMEMGLPAGAVVSRATLWVNGSEREAAFGERGVTRQAYQSVVRASRDPLLVTSSGPGRVLVQCFPVPPGGDMKIRIGVTAPVLPDGVSDRGTVMLPVMLTRNFDATEPASIWLESRASLASDGRGLEAILRDDGVRIIRGSYQSGQAPKIRISGLMWVSTWAEDGGQTIEQRFVERETARPEHVAVVVDGSESTRAMRRGLGAALASIPEGIERQVTVATRTGLMKWSPEMPWGGGVNPLPAIEDALRARGGSHPAVVVWIAGDQPVKLPGTERIRQILERERGRVVLCVLASGGANAILKELDGVPSLETIPHTGDADEDLRHFFGRWRAGERERVAERRVVTSPPAGSPASSHIVRLWAAQEVAARTERDRQGAVALAVKHRIITPLSGAVVLETAEQYKRNGLDPPEGQQTATTVTPEPATWVLMGAALIVIVLIGRRRAQYLR